MRKEGKKNTALNTAHRIFLLTVCVLSLVYYVTCICFAHIGVSWLWIWPALSIFCFLRWIMLRKNIRVPKVISVIYMVVMTAAVLVFVIVEAKIVNAMSIEPVQNLDYVITLGAAVRNGQPTLPLIHRIDKTAEYLLENPDCTAIASGGQGANEAVSEAQSIKQELVGRGIGEDRIILEEESADTDGNIQNSFKLIPEGSKVGVVTSSFHIYRALRIAELNGYEVYGVPAYTNMPLGIHYIVREFFAVVQLELRNLIK